MVPMYGWLEFRWRGPQESTVGPTLVPRRCPPASRAFDPWAPAGYMCTNVGPTVDSYGPPSPESSQAYMGRFWPGSSTFPYVGVLLNLISWWSPPTIFPHFRWEDLERSSSQPTPNLMGNFGGGSSNPEIPKSMFLRFQKFSRPTNRSRRTGRNCWRERSSKPKASARRIRILAPIWIRYSARTCASSWRILAHDSCASFSAR